MNYAIVFGREERARRASPKNACARCVGVRRDVKTIKISRAVGWRVAEEDWTGNRI